MIDANRQPILEGNLADFNLIEVLQVLSMSRQYTRVEVFDDKRHSLGTIHIKSGKVVQAADRTYRGRAAFLQLVRGTSSWFRVYRIAMPALVPEPVGSLASLLVEALEAVSSPPPPAVSSTPTRAASTHPSQPAAARSGEARSQSGFYAQVVSPGPCVVAVASPKGGSGKTTVSLNLALALARRQQRIILVDGDINGDVMSSIDERTTGRAGVFDILSGTARAQDALRKTVVKHLEILPAVGRALPSTALAFADYRERWQQLLAELAQRADIVLVDTPAGMLGMTYQILSGCTHILGVLQAEVIAQRSFSMFADCLNLLPNNERPKVLGVFLNMLQLRHRVSVEVLKQACEKLPQEWLFETSIPRHTAFLDATAAGLPLHMCDPQQMPAVTWLFDTLATEVMERLTPLSQQVAPQRAGSFLA
jgi:chromosome partitioning protein